MQVIYSVRDPCASINIDFLNLISSTSHSSDRGSGTPAPTWWLYLLACKDGRTYAGIATDVEARFRVHISGKGSKFTRSNPPVAILGVQSFATKSEALKAEHALKQLEKPEKLGWARRYPASLNPK